MINKDKQDCLKSINESRLKDIKRLNKKLEILKQAEEESLEYTPAWKTFLSFMKRIFSN